MIFLLILVVCKDVFATESSKDKEGYPRGYVSDCPAATKPAVITRKSLRQLAFLNGRINGTERRYNYYEMAALASDPYFDFNKPTVVYVSGYLDSPQFFHARLVADAYTDLGYNVLSLDTHKFMALDYQVACRLCRPVGKHTAEMLANLTQVGLDPKKLQLLGLSLGAHMSSFTAKHYKKLTGFTISRITGLDPAGPCFRHLGPDQRIDSTDADFVDIISTNIDGIGMAAPVADVQFYVNGGEYQPGGLLVWYICGHICSHLYSISIWLSAVRNPSSFIGIQCDSVQQARDIACYDRLPLVTNVMGLNTDRNRTGIFYLSTGQLPPYYLGDKGLREKNDFVLKKLKVWNNVDVYVI